MPVCVQQQQQQEPAAAAALGGVLRPGAVDLPLFHCFVLVHVDGGDGVLGAGLNLPFHLPLGVLGLGLEEVDTFLCFDPAGNNEGGRKGTSQFY